MWGLSRKWSNKGLKCVNDFTNGNDVQRRRQWHPTLVLLPGKSHGRRSLVGCRPWSRWGSDMTERLHFSLSCIREGNGNPLQCSCLENPRDGGAWRAAVYGVAQSRTRLKWISLDQLAGNGLISDFYCQCFQYWTIFIYLEYSILSFVRVTIILSFLLLLFRLIAYIRPNFILQYPFSLLCNQSFLYLI